jgi:hypothetical protein
MIILAGLKKFEYKIRPIAVEYKNALFAPIYTMSG